VNISRLQSFHKKDQFECEEASLSHYLKTQASQDIRKKLALCFVATNAMDQVMGYYTLSAQSLSRSVIPEKHRKKVPNNYHVPLILLGRLARDITYKGQGIGELLLIDALLRSFKISQKELGAMAVVVDPNNNYARSFYGSFGFIPLDGTHKMFLPMNTIKKM